MFHDRRGRRSFCVGPYTLGTASEKGERKGGKGERRVGRKRKRGGVKRGGVKRKRSEGEEE